MAKALSVAEIRTAMRDMGVTLSDEQIATMQEANKAKVRAAVVKIVANKLPRTVSQNKAGEDVTETDAAFTKRVESFATKLLTLSDDFTAVVANEKNQGRGKTLERVIGIDTAHGHLKITLSEVI